MNDDVLKKWLMCDNPFPREYTLHRKITSSYSFFKRYILSGVDKYSAIFSSSQIQNRCFNKIFIDIDSHDKSLTADENIQNAYEKYCAVKEVLQSNELECMVYFTGCGFHLYIPFPDTHLELYKDVVKHFVFNDLMLRDIDKRVVGDIRRMARVPYSKHGKTNNYMVCIGNKWGLEKILRASKKNAHYTNPIKINDWLSEYLADIENDIRSRKINYSQKNVKIDIVNDELPDCIVEGIEKLKKYGELTDEHRFHIASYLLRMWEFEKVVDVFRYGSDFNEQITRYRLNHIQKSEMLPYSCRRCYELGICNRKKCIWYDYCRGWLGNLIK